MKNELKTFLIATAGYFGVPHGQAIAAIRDAGFRGIELLCKPGHFEPENPAHVKEIEAALAGWPDAIITFHAPFHTADLGSTDPEVRKADVKYVADSLRVAQQFGSRSATIHVRGRGLGAEWEDGNWTAFREALVELVPVAAECGMALCVENMPAHRFAGKPNDLLGLLEGHPSDQLGVCFDTGHANFAGEVIEIGSALASRTFVMHIHDNHAIGKDEHSIPGEGNIHWPKLVDSLRENGYRGWNVIEYVERDAQNNSIDRFRDKLSAIGKSITNTGLSGLNGRTA